MKKILFSLFAVAALAVGCKKPDTPVDPVKGDFVKLDKTSVTIVEGETATLVATYEPATLTLSWSSSDEAVATVADGVVTAVAEGTAVITVKAGVAEAKCNVTVEAKPAPKGEEYAYTVNAKSAWAVQWEGKTASSAQWTIEVKFRKNGDWHTDGISNRFITVGNLGEKGIMMRFNDDGGKHVGSEEYGILQVCSLPSVGNFYVGENTEKNPEGPYKFAAAEGGEVALFKFMKDTWYTVSYVNDGEKLYMYINGELHATINDAAYELQLQRVDLGMVWGYASDGHDGKTGWVYRQAFDGDISYARVWYKACTQAEIKANLCKLENDKAADLQMNLLFNEGEGTKIADKTGNGYDYDLANAWWDNGSHDPCPKPEEVATASWKFVEATCE